MKAVLISIRPEWCLLIAVLKKILEIRKTRPKINVPFKVYIYCCLDKRKILWNCKKYGFSYRYIDEKSHNIFDKPLNGKVIGEFICDGIIRNCEMANADIVEHQGCIKREELLKYSNGKELFGWHISNLKIYDKPKELYEFYRKCEKLKCETCEHLKYQRVNPSEYDYDCEFIGGHIPITRPPQSWCYVEELNYA